MMLDMKFLLYLFPGLIIGLTFHEAAHAYSAMLLGDMTAKKQGRVTLNPLRHLSPLGTLALFLIGFGWGNPVIINVYNFKNPKRDYLISSLAGPAANVMICLAIWLALRMRLPENIEALLVGTYIINGILAIFNLIPISPLDGSKIWPCLIPSMKIINPTRFRMAGLIILIMLIASGGIGRLIEGVISMLARLLMNADAVESFVKFIHSGG